MKKMTIANRNLTILVLSLLPFFIGLSYSLLRSSDREYLSVAINIAGSERMRTMLLANYSNQLFDASTEDDVKKQTEYTKILETELDIYMTYFDALVKGSDSLGVKPNQFEDILVLLIQLSAPIDLYTASIKELIANPSSIESIHFIQDNAMTIKDYFHTVTESYQQTNDRYINSQRIIDITMISIAASVTLIGLLLTSKIRYQEYHANYDFLTKLKNRHSLYSDIMHKPTHDCSVFFIDLNKFKAINDTYGHSIGDEILIEISKRLQQIFGCELLYRYGGDEFIVVLEDTDMSHTIDTETKRIETLIKAVKQNLLEPIIDSNGRSHLVGLSMGVVSKYVQIEDWRTLITLSDDLMYDSKNMMDHVMFYRTRMDLDARLKFIRSIDMIFSNGIINLHYNPIHYLSNDTIFCYNALSRWEDTDGSFFASEFLPILKRKGYLTELDKYTLINLEKDYLASTQASTTKNNIRYCISITDETLLNCTSNGYFTLLNNLKIPSHVIILKIHEGLIANPKVQYQLSLLKKSGYTLAVDTFTLDFSIQNSNYFDQIDILKLGKTLVTALTELSPTQNLMKEFIKMLVGMDKKIIIEQVSSLDTLNELKQLDSKYEDHLLYSKQTY